MTAKKRWDISLLILVLALLIIGVPMVFSSSFLIALAKDLKPYHFLLRQLLWVFLGLIAMLFFLLINLKYLMNKFVIYASLLVSIILLLMPFTQKGNIHRWIELGFINIQPSEIAKLAIMLYLGYTFSKIEPPISLSRAASVCLPILIMIFLIIKEPDLGTSFLILSVLLTFLFLAGLEKKYLFSIIIIALISITFLIVNEKYRIDRIFAFIHQDKISQNEIRASKIFQLTQAKIAIGSGGIRGLGFTNSIQKLYYIPQLHNDFIFSIIGEELGFIGTFAIWLIYLIIFIKGILIVKKSKSKQGSYLALAIILMITYQALINMSVVLGLLPTKGITLPFISYGGSSMLTCLSSLGLLLNISQDLK